MYMTGDYESYKMNVSKTWSCTSALRVIREPLAQDRLQQGWFCHETGEIEWRDVEIIQAVSSENQRG